MRLLMIPPVSTTTINFVRKKAQLGTFYVKAWKQGSHIVTLKPLAFWLISLSISLSVSPPPPPQFHLLAMQK